jgi:DNA-binding response OmpR family regulator
MAHEEKPDLIILDIMMPAGNGLSVFKNLQDSVATAFIPVIFLTACASEETRKQALEMGAKDFLTKPFNAEELLLKVKKALAEA